ncbi:hypothetical protein BC830DRAFT_1218327 [Chytriomyces sp. MP71]|nr:hypothetical protein BC830DRAFT_1218327 [Chytriomyces sp. MP71]
MTDCQLLQHLFPFHAIANDCCNARVQFARVSCNPYGQITSLAINTGYESTIPDQLGELEALVSLDLSSNKLYGSIPPSLGLLESLQYLDLSINNLDGPIPSEFSHLKYLNYLHLESNMLSGTIPSQLQNISFHNFENNCFHSFPHQNSSCTFTQFAAPLPLPNKDCQNLADALTAAGFSPLPAGSCCTWPGIGCTQDRVTRVYLPDAGLRGVLVDAWGALPGLEELVLRGNGLRSGVPKGLGNATRLMILDLAGNRVEGAVPSELNTLKRLGQLYLNDNLLSEKLPDLSGLKQLVVINCQRNYLSGPFPASLSFFAAGFEYNCLSGTNLQNQANCILPDTIYRIQIAAGILTLILLIALLIGFYWQEKAAFTRSIKLNDSMHQLLLNSESMGRSGASGGLVIPAQPDTADCRTVMNAFTPPLLICCSAFTGAHDNPVQIQCTPGGNVTSISGLHRKLTTGLTGSLPASLGALSYLQSLDLSENHFSGEIPASYANLTALTLLNLADNSLSGPFPKGLSELPLLNALFLQNNHISGALPSNLLNFSRHNYDNNCLKNVPNQDPSCVFNPFAASRPPNNTDCAILSTAMAMMGFIVPIPASGCCMWNMRYVSCDEYGFVTGLTFGSSGLKGAVPWSLFGLSQLSVLEFNNNALTSSIPEEIGKATNLQVVDFSYNALSGTIPTSVANLTRLQQFYVQYNQLSGPIPNSLGMLPQLNQANFAQNHFTGSIPQGLSWMTVGFDHNCLSGTSFPYESECEESSVGGKIAGSVVGTIVLLCLVAWYLRRVYVKVKEAQHSADTLEFADPEKPEYWGEDDAVEDLQHEGTESQRRWKS